MAIDEKVTAQRVSYERLAKKLEADGQVLRK